MYAKVFASMWDGTLYGQWEAWSVFVFLLAHADREGFIDMHPKAISARTGLPLESVEKGLNILESEDPHSRSTDLEGRRIEHIDAHRPWGWRIVNYTKYRELQDADSVRAQTRDRVRKHRESKRNALRNAVTVAVTDGNGQKRHADVEAEAGIVLSNESTQSQSDENIPIDEWFDRFLWPLFPRRKGTSKAKALRACRAAFRATPPSRHDQLGDDLVAGVSAYADSVQDKDPQFILHPATIINQRPWDTLDEPA